MRTEEATVGELADWVRAHPHRAVRMLAFGSQISINVLSTRSGVPEIVGFAVQVPNNAPPGQEEFVGWRVGEDPEGPIYRSILDALDALVR